MRVFTGMTNDAWACFASLRFAHPTRWNLRHSFGVESIEPSPTSAPTGRDREGSRLQGGNRHAGKHRILPAEGGGVRGTRARSRRQGHARAFPQISEFMAERSEAIRILSPGRSRRDPAAAAAFVRARAQHARLAFVPERRAHR